MREREAEFLQVKEEEGKEEFKRLNLHLACRFKLLCELQICRVFVSLNIHIYFKDQILKIKKKRYLIYLLCKYSDVVEFHVHKSDFMK